MPSHTLIQDGRARDADRFSDPADLSALDGNKTIDVLHIANDTDLNVISPALGRIETILIDFPAYTDGRGFSLAKQLRNRYGYEGLLIADGPLIPDQYAFALQCGFSAVHIDDATLKRHTIEDWHAALDDFDLTYQRGYAVKAGPATSVFDARSTGLQREKGEGKAADPFFGHSAELTLRKSIKKYQGDIVLATSMGVDSAVLLHMVSRIDPSVPVIFLDTGKHFRETLGYRDELVSRFGLTDFRNITPDQASVETEDPDGSLNQTEPDNCCDLRKVRPLDAVINGFGARITGRKRYQTPQRADMPILEEGGAQAKVNPLAYWTAKDVTQYMRQHDLPPHPLLALGYLSIGCQPCTTRVTAGEDPRAGRWRHSEKTECGIHMVDGKWVSSEKNATFEAF
jgi:phosphoadenylyl-sulfate reductase (thioredoxin)